MTIRSTFWQVPTSRVLLKDIKRKREIISHELVSNTCMESFIVTMYCCPRSNPFLFLDNHRLYFAIFSVPRGKKPTTSCYDGHQNEDRHRPRTLVHLI